METEIVDVITPAFEGWPYLPDAFDAAPVVVHGVAVHVLSIAALIDTKQQWQDHFGEAMRPHDAADLHALRPLG